MEEIYCYKVVYENGIFIRVSPAIDAERTGEVLPCGTIFESRKSLFLDGVNYVQLDDGRGWVFSRKDDILILDLIEVTRKPIAEAVETNEKLDDNSQDVPSSGDTKRRGKDSKSSGSMDKIAKEGLVPSDSSITSDEDEESEESSVSSIQRRSRYFRNVYPSSAALSYLPASVNPMSDIEEGSDNFDAFAFAYQERRDRTRSSFPPTTVHQSQPVYRSSKKSVVYSPNHHNHHREKNRRKTVEQLWKMIQERIRHCQSFDGLCILITHGLGPEISPPTCSEPGPARSAWLAEADEEDIRLRETISSIISVTRHYAEFVSDITGLETHLWVLAHMGANCTQHMMSLYVKAANDRFDSLSPQAKINVLNRANEIGMAAKLHNSDLAKQIDILADDLRNLLQRWIIIKAIDNFRRSSSSRDDDATNRKSKADEKIEKTLQQIEEIAKKNTQNEANDPSTSAELERNGMLTNLINAIGFK